MRLPTPLVTPAWLAEHLHAPTLRVLDTSWYLPAARRDARAEYEAARVPGAMFFDVDAASDQATALPHMLPSADTFARYAATLGVGDGDAVVVYDGSGTNLSAGRAWFMFRAFGHERVAVLDGGRERWLAGGYPVERGPAPAPRPAAHPIPARLDDRRVRDRNAMLANLATGAEQVVDARSAGRFAGTEPEPRPGLRGGHVPGSANLPFGELVDPATGQLLDPATLRARLAEHRVDLARPIVATCGSGTSACAIALALESLGHDAWAVYDGSWAEWGADDALPVAHAGAPLPDTNTPTRNG
ncbi:MAG TPA: rhodanese-like domain-containing protein [Gemmatimonadaceae bacterium]|nr:rhodanese-like domain-containing protein [Gemmatimonadaceae bacterium]